MLHAYNFHLTGGNSQDEQVFAGPIPDGAIFRRIKFTGHNTVTGQWLWAAALVSAFDASDASFGTGVRLLESGRTIGGQPFPVWTVDNVVDRAFVWEGYFHRRIIGGPMWVHLRGRALSSLTYRMNGFVEWEDASPDFAAVKARVPDGSE